MKLGITVVKFTKGVSLPEYKRDLSDLEFKIIRPNIAQIYATSSVTNLEDTRSISTTYLRLLCS